MEAARGSAPAAMRGKRPEKGSASGECPGCCKRKRKTWVTHPGPPKNRPCDNRRVQGAPEPKHRGAPCHRTGERPATAQGSALATAQGSALALSIRSAATSHRHGQRASAGRERAATVPAPTAASVSKLFRNQAFRERLNTFGVLKFFITPPAQGSALPDCRQILTDKSSQTNPHGIL